MEGGVADLKVLNQDCILEERVADIVQQELIYPEKEDDAGSTMYPFLFHMIGDTTPMDLRPLTHSCDWGSNTIGSAIPCSFI